MKPTESAWLDKIDRWLTWLAAGDKSPETIRLRAHYLGLLAGAYRLRLPECLETDDLAAVLARPDWQAETRKSARSSFRSFHGWMHATGRIDRDPAAILPPIAVPRGVARAAPVESYVQAMERADLRGRRVLALARFGGLRRGEIARVRGDDVGDDGWLLVHGKGGHERRIPLHPMLRPLIASDPGWLFPGPYGHISSGHVGKIGSRLLPDRWTLHTLRHRAGTDWYAVSRDLRAVQQLLGHADVRTTQRYVHTPDDALIAAVMGVAS